MLCEMRLPLLSDFMPETYPRSFFESIKKGFSSVHKKAVEKCWGLLEFLDSIKGESFLTR